MKFIITLFAKRSIIALAVLSLSLLSEKGSTQNKLPNKALEFVGGYSTHGSGDMRGIIFGAGYKTYLSKKFSLNYNMRAHIHSSKEEIIILSPLVNNGRKDASIRFTTAGAQLGINAGYSLWRNRQHEFMVSAGGFGRYQSASNGSDGYSITFNSSTPGLPRALVEYDNRTPQQTITAGYIVLVNYNYTLNNNMYIGVEPGFQNDTNGDVLSQVALTIGKRF